MARFSILTLTDKAAQRIKEICAAHKGAQGLLLGVKKGGCAGLEYSIDLVTQDILATKPKMDKIEQGGAIVFIEPQAVLFLLGTKIDFEATPLRTGFIFNNPNQTSACGCGESVEITPATAEAFQQKAQSA